MQLLAQSGLPIPPAGTVGCTAWLQAVIDGLCDLSSRDPLTGLGNRRQLERALSREIDRVARAGEPAMLLMIDIDHFKRINDSHGHAAGDQVIQAVARALSECVRPMDTVTRFGGEEFSIILPNCQPAFGHAVAERIRTKVEQLDIPIAGGHALHVTISLGGAFAPQWVRSSTALWIDRADSQLYQAKSEGRNRTCLEASPVSMVSAEERGFLFSISQFQVFD